MLMKRIIPCLDIRDGRVVKGVKFAEIQDVSDPVELAAFYNSEGADELVFYDITASIEGRGVFVDLLRRVVESIQIPLTVGGGIAALDDVERMLACGVEKVSINSGAIHNPRLIYDAARKIGSERVVLGMDVSQVDGRYHLFSSGGQKDTGLDAVEWAKQAEENGAGELVVNSIDTDGVKEGFDLPMLAAISGAVSIPVVASGGAGNSAHFVELFQTLPAISAGLAASIFHFREVRIGALKQELQKNNIPVHI